MALWTAFMLGLAGSLHCAGMCGPLLLALSKARGNRPHANAGRMLHHLGRLLSYSLLGLAAGGLGRIVALAGFRRGLSIALGLLLVAGVIAARRSLLAAPIGRGLLWIKRRMNRFTESSPVLGDLATGALNGLLPCGLVYAAALGAAATGSAAMGAASMAMFGLGTVPMLFAIHFAGNRLPLPARLSIPLVTKAALLLMGTLLILRGLELGIPCISPAGGCGACH